jgi:hypothetical protein
MEEKMHRLHTEYGVPVHDVLLAAVSGIRRRRLPGDNQLAELARAMTGPALRRVLSEMSYREVLKFKLMHPRFDHYGENESQWLTLQPDEFIELANDRWYSPRGWYVPPALRAVYIQQVTLYRMPEIENCTFISLQLCNVGAGESLRDIESVYLESCDITRLIDMRCRRLFIKNNALTSYDHFSHITELFLENCRVEDASAFAGVRKLSLKGNPTLTTTAGLGSQEYLDVSGTALTYIDALANVKCLIMSNLPYLRQPSKKFTCELVWANGLVISDVSFLSEVPRVSLIGAQADLDISSLGRQTSLDLQACRLTNVDVLRDVEELDLSNNPLTDVSQLGRQRVLSLEDCPVVDVSTLGNVRYLNLEGTKVADISALGGQAYLSIARTEVRAINGIDEVPRLDVRELKGRLWMGRRELVVADEDQVGAGFQDVTTIVYEPPKPFVDYFHLSSFVLDIVGPSVPPLDPV